MNFTAQVSNIPSAEILAQQDMLTTQTIQRRSDFIFNKVFEPYKPSKPIIPLVFRRTTMEGTGQTDGSVLSYMLQSQNVD